MFCPAAVFRRRTGSCAGDRQHPQPLLQPQSLPQPLPQPQLLLPPKPQPPQQMRRRMMMMIQLQFPPKQFIREPPLIDVSHTMWRLRNVLQPRERLSKSRTTHHMQRFFRLLFGKNERYLEHPLQIPFVLQVLFDRRPVLAELEPCAKHGAAFALKSRLQVYALSSMYRTMSPTVLMFST